MSRPLPLLAPALLLLAACTPTATDVASAAPAATTATPTPAAASPSVPVEHVGDVAVQAERAEVAASASASISGVIRDGNRPPPALRVCATPLSGGISTCVDTPQGASRYRIEVAPGRYYLLGWVRSGELKLIAHASQIRCIRAPCPLDTLFEVTVAAGEQRDGVDLGAGYGVIPEGWPHAPD